MLFGDAPRVKYHKQPLTEVVCQLRFPRILKIDSGLPEKFQDAIRTHYPLFQERQEQSSIQIPNEFQEVMQPLLDEFNQSTRLFDFISEDEKWKITLTSSFIALSTHDYTKWEIFKEKLQSPLSALAEIYQPNFFTRAGLRYVDVIQKDKLDLGAETWSALLNPLLLGELGDSKIGDRVREAQRISVIELDIPDEFVRLQHGIGRDNSTQKPVYVIDSDFSTTKRITYNDWESVLDRFNRYSRNVFRWVISDQLHSAMEPESIP